LSELIPVPKELLADLLEDAIGVYNEIYNSERYDKNSPVLVAQLKLIEDTKKLLER